MSTSTHPIIILSYFDVEDAFSSTDYTPALLDYSLASPGNTSFDSKTEYDPSDDLYEDCPAPLAITHFPDDPYMQIRRGYHHNGITFIHTAWKRVRTPQAHIASPLVLLHDIHAEGMTLSETFQVAAIIEKLPPSWVEFKNYLKHKRKEMSVEDLVVRLRIEEDNKLAQKDTYTPDSAKANMVEHAGSSSRFNSKGNKKDKKKNDKKGKGKSEYLAPKAGIVKQKFQGTCYNCDQPGHRAANCKMPKRVNPRQANMVDENVDMIAMVSDVCAMISEVNLVGTNNSGWWIDTGATRHVCADKSMFHSFRAVDNGHLLCKIDIEHMIPPTPPRDTEPPVRSPIPSSPSSSVGSSSPIIPRLLGSEPVPEEPNESDAG
ncbi:pol polyprotein [Tanacetum coccineum]